MKQHSQRVKLRKFLWLGEMLLVLSLAALSAQAEEVLSGIPAAFVDIGYGARPMGMGGAYVALAQDAQAVLWNPAGLTAVPAKEVSLMYAHQMALIPYIFASYSQSFWETQGIGAAVIYSGDEVLSESTILVGYAHSLDRVSDALKGIRIGLSTKIRLALSLIHI